MSLPRMSLHIGDYLKDTGHLSAAQHGAYFLLILHYWNKRGLPDDDQQLARIACLSPAEWKRHKSVIQEFFRDGWKHDRIEKEIADAEEKYRRRVEAGRKGGKAKAKAQHSHSNASSDAMAMPKQPITDNPKEIRERVGRADEKLISDEAFALSDSVLLAMGEDREAPEWCGFPHIAQMWLTEKIPKDFALATCANLRGKHRNYLDKAVRNSWRDRQSEPKTRRKHEPGTSAKSGLAAIDRVFDGIADQRGRLEGPNENAVLSLPARSVR